MAALTNPLSEPPAATAAQHVFPAATPADPPVEPRLADTLRWGEGSTSEERTVFPVFRDGVLRKGGRMDAQHLSDLLALVAEISRRIAKRIESVEEEFEEVMGFSSFGRVPRHRRHADATEEPARRYNSTPSRWKRFSWPETRTGRWSASTGTNRSGWRPAYWNS